MNIQNKTIIKDELTKSDIEEILNNPDLPKQVTLK
jgi:hypothetical protein